MQLSTKGRYAVMALADLAMQGGTVPLAAISERQEISLPYLEQIFLKLRRAGLVDSLRGPGGGYTLARPCAEITIAEVMSAVDEPVKMTRCAAEDTGCIGDHRCLTHDLWRALGDHIVAFLDRTTLADLVDNATARTAVYQARAEAVSATGGKLAEGA
ncbi:MAG: Rrf2 family transcriptional regulator [Hyphomicrobiales bacterium]